MGGVVLEAVEDGVDETPSQLVSSFDHFVTQWMSTVGSSVGSCRNSSHVQVRRSSP